MSGFSFIDNSNKFLQELERKKREFAIEAGMKMEEYAKKNMTLVGYVDTGRARNSITYTYTGKEAFTYSYKDDSGTDYSYNVGSATSILGSLFGSKFTIYLGSNVEYFPYLEEGTLKIKAGHMLQDAIEGHRSEYQQMFIDIMKK